MLSLRKNRDFQQVLKKGKTITSSCLVLRYLESPGDNRYGFLVSSRAFKKAVLRNRIKRRLREALRQVLKGAKQKDEAGKDLIFIARIGIETRELNDVKEIMSFLLSKAGF